MERLRIQGGTPLQGEITASGSKNASLPMMAASLLTPETITLSQIPELQDIRTMCNLLQHMGVNINPSSDGELQLKAESIPDTVAPYDLVKTMRASFLVLGPLVARFGDARVSLPGGCAIGTRPVDQHLMALSKLGAEIDVVDGYVVAKTQDRLKGCDIRMDVVTVTGTQNTLLAASLARGKTRILNAASEPEVATLARMLNAMGARVRGAGTSTIEVDGVDELHGTSMEVPTDRIEVGTYLIAGFATKGTLTVANAPDRELDTVLDKLREAGASISVSNKAIHIDSHKQRPRAVDIETEVFPGIPTDLQAQFMVLNAVAEGNSCVTENIFENRFMHVQELARLGANIRLNGTSQAHIKGVAQLCGAQVMATDLRASSCLVIAGLIAEGETVVDRIYHLDRGYEHLEQKLGSLGATLSREN